MTRDFLQPADLHDLVRDQFGTNRRLTSLDRISGGTKKGVYRLRLDDTSTVMLYLWAPGENYWPPSTTVPDDPFTDASGAELFAVNHAALTAAGVRVPRLDMLDRDGRFLGSDVALVEDVGSMRLETLMEQDPAAAAEPLAAVGDALRRMHTTFGPRYGRLTEDDAPRSRPASPDQPTSPGQPASPGRPASPGQPASPGRPASSVRPAEDVIVGRALCHLDAVAARDARIAAARDRIAGHVGGLRAAVAPRQAYALVHGELGPDHVFVTPEGEAVMIDIEGLTWFDVEWEHAFLQMRFGEAYPDLRPVALDAARLELYRYAQVLALIEGPLRIADTDFPDRDWMLQLAEWNIGKALAPCL